MKPMFRGKLEQSSKFPGCTITRWLDQNMAASHWKTEKNAKCTSRGGKRSSKKTLTWPPPPSKIPPRECWPAWPGWEYTLTILVSLSRIHETRRMCHFVVQEGCSPPSRPSELVFFINRPTTASSVLQHWKIPHCCLLKNQAVTSEISEKFQTLQWIVQHVSWLTLEEKNNKNGHCIG